MRVNNKCILKFTINDWWDDSSNFKLHSKLWISETYKFKRCLLLSFSDKIFIGLGSIPGVSDTKETELIDIDQAFSRCKSLGKYPLEIGYNAYGLMKGQPLICGGYKKTKPIRTNECYLYYKVAS